MRTGHGAYAVHCLRVCQLGVRCAGRIVQARPRAATGLTHAQPQALEGDAWARSAQCSTKRANQALGAARRGAIGGLFVESLPTSA